MAVLKITQADIKKLETRDAGWYPATITKVSDPTPNKGKDGYNYIVTFTLDDGKEIINYYSSKLIAMIIPLIEAVTGAKVTEELDFDTSMLVGKKVDLKLAVEIYNGNPQNKIEAYLPYGTGKNQQAPF